MPKVTGGHSWILRMPLPAAHVVGHESTIDFVGVHLDSDSGHTGSGFAFVVECNGAYAVKSMLDHVVLPAVVGTETYEVAKFWERISQQTQRIGRGVTSLAISAVDTALWDLAARERNLSLADHIGKVVDRVPAYASGEFSPTLPLKDVIQNAQNAVELGLKALKIRVGIDLRADVDRVKALRHALGADVRIMCDANQRLNLGSAQWLSRKLEPFDIFWFEEPLPAQDIAGHARLAASTDIPVAVGEHLQSISEFARFIDAGAAHIFQPDVGQIAGTTEFLRIGSLVREQGLMLAPHYMPEFHVHLSAAFSNTIYVERFPGADRWMKYPLELDEGNILVPTRPGHGVEFTDEAWATLQLDGA